ncbi:MAG: exodeoxyribonuclease VII large subunit [Erysipelotrichaceae bacterium]|nr:exodeoxyribonuclease VII large subunit [Erysipelotrichaceae bacterium]
MKYLSVYALNRYIKNQFDQDVNLQNIYIKGEISNYRPHPSGHIYFTLKDEHAKINSIMFASFAKKLKFQLENGMQVLIHGYVSVYEASGQYQLYVQSMQKDGIGLLHERYEMLKKQLEQEGLFDISHKKDIPSYPKSIAVLSAKQGAAVQDIVRTIHLRFPIVRVFVFPIPVQGKEAYKKIVEVLRSVDKIGFDTIIIARGGGSIEDLWNFNEEDLARCIYACQTPIISGIGHETDFTICDFVSDYRAVTPTAAAIKATPDKMEMSRQINQLNEQLIYRMNQYLISKKICLDRLQKSYYLTNAEILYSNEILRLMNLSDHLSHYLKIFEMNNRQLLNDNINLLQQNFIKLLKNKQNTLQQNIISLDALSPLKVMQRGYVLIHHQNTMIKSSSLLNKDDEIDSKFYEIPLEDSISLFQEGIQLSQYCDKKLKTIQAQVAQIYENGQLKDFQGEE